MHACRLPAQERAAGPLSHQPPPPPQDSCQVPRMADHITHLPLYDLWVAAFTSAAISIGFPYTRVALISIVWEVLGRGLAYPASID